MGPGGHRFYDQRRSAVTHGVITRFGLISNKDQSHTHEIVNVIVTSSHTYTAHHTLVHGYTHVPSHQRKNKAIQQLSHFWYNCKIERYCISNRFCQMFFFFFFLFVQVVTNNAKIIVFIKLQTLPYIDKDSLSIEHHIRLFLW